MAGPSSGLVHTKLLCLGLISGKTRAWMLAPGRQPREHSCAKRTHVRPFHFGERFLPLPLHLQRCRRKEKCLKLFVGKRRTDARFTRFEPLVEARCRRAAASRSP